MKQAQLDSIFEKKDGNNDDVKKLANILDHFQKFKTGLGTNSIAARKISGIWPHCKSLSTFVSLFNEVHFFFRQLMQF